MFKIVRKEVDFGGSKLILETGKIARQATASVMAQMGDTVVLCAVVGAKEAKAEADFFPLTVHYQEKFYSAGRIPGGYNKRESRPSEREVLISRLIDRPVRPLFPEGYFNEVQVVCTLLSFDPNHQPDIVAMAAVSAALSISGIPFKGPIGASRVGLKNGEYILNPSETELKDGSVLDLVVAGTESAVLMVESEAQELTEEQMLGAVMFGHKAFQPVISAIQEMNTEVGNAAWEVTLQDNSELIARVEKMVGKQVEEAYKELQKQVRYGKLDALKKEVVAALVESEEALSKNLVIGCFEAVKSRVVREKAINEKLRIDGRSPVDVRNIVAEVDILPRTHGSALFTRGETQALVVATLGTGEDEQMVDKVDGLIKERLMLHYNFPSYSVGECGRMGAPGRREIGHGKLAYRAINPLMPSKEQFPYTIRLVSEITESNGSSSMATVCGSSLALMAAGVPLPAPIAGIAMGLIKEKDKFVVLSDIMGDEDHLGDMDFKVAGTAKGITALQMDIKIDGITEEIMQIALNQAKDGRAHILSKMEMALNSSRGSISTFAPQINSFKIPKEKIGELIGPGGKMIKSIVERTGVKIDIQDDGTVNVASNDGEAMKSALEIIGDIIAVAEVGKIYEGKISKIADFGLFVNILKNTDGLAHVSEMVGRTSDYKEGQIVKVKVLALENNKIKLTMKFGDAKAPESSDSIGIDDFISDDISNQENSSNEEKSHHKKRGKFDKRGSGKRDDNRSDRGNRSERNERREPRERDDFNDRNDRSDSSNSSGKKRRFF